MLFNSGNPSILGLIHLYSGDPSDAGNPMWTDQQKKDEANLEYERLREIERLKDQGHARKRAYSDAVSGQMLYQLPADFSGRLAVEISNNGSDLSTAAPSSADIIVLKPTAYDAAFDAESNAVLTGIKHFFLLDDHFGIYEKPGAAQAGTNTIRIRYEATTTHLSGNSDEPVIMLPYHRLIPLGAAISLRMSKNLTYSHLQLQYDRLFVQYRIALQERAADYEGQIPVAGMAGYLNRSNNVGRMRKR